MKLNAGKTEIISFFKKRKRIKEKRKTPLAVIKLCPL
jgi:hypothetical protein